MSRDVALVLLLLVLPAAVRATPPRTLGFRESARFPLGRAPVAIATGDIISKDGRVDVVVANADSTLTLLDGDGTGGLSERGNFPGGGGEGAGVLVGDLDHDGALDFAASLPVEGRLNCALTANGFPNSSSLAGPWTPGVFALLPRGNAAPDLIVSDLFFQALVVAVNDGFGSFHFGPQLAGFVDPLSLATGDVDGDGVPDVAVADGNTHSATVVTDPGEAGQARHDQPLAGRPVAVALGDLDRDGHDDLVVATRSPAELAVCRGAAGGSIGPAHADPAGAAPSSLVLADFDGDGRLDAAVADEDRASISLWAGRGDGTFSRYGDIPTGAGPIALAVADMNGDGWPDLVCANHDDRTIQVLLNTQLPPPGAIQLLAPAPNPASSTARLTLQLSTSMTVRIEIHDLAGRLVRRLVDGSVMPPGSHSVEWDGRTDRGDLAHSGLYLVRVRAGNAEAKTRLVLQR